MPDWGDEIKPRSDHAGVGGLDKLLKCARRGDLQTVERAVSENPWLLQAHSGGHNRSLVWEAARGGRSDLLRYLLDSGAAADIPGRIRSEIQVVLTPLCISIRYRKHPVTDLLRASGVEADIYAHSYLGNLPEAREALSREPALLDAEVDFDSVWRVTAFHYAVAGGNQQLVRYFISLGARVRPYSRLLLNIAARNRDPEMFELLVEAGIDETFVDDWYRHQV